MIKAEDLMIGDWVLQCELNVPVKVQSIMRHYADEDVYFYHEAREYISNVSKLEPIPLTDEILKKNFETNGFGCYYIYKNEEIGESLYYHFETRSIVYKPDKHSWTCDGPVIKYVHELQHFLKGIKIEKEVVL